MRCWSVLVAAVPIVIAAVIGAACGEPYAADSDPGPPDVADAGSSTDAGADADADAVDGSDASTAAPQVLASGYNGLVAVAATETTVYFSDQGTGKVHAIRLEGDSAVTDALVASAVTAMVVNAQPDGVDTLYFVERGQNVVGRKQGMTNSAVIASNGVGPFGIAIRTAGDASLGTRVVVAGAVGTNTELQQYDGSLVFLSAIDRGAANVFDVAALGPSFYWTESANGVIAKSDWDNGMSVKLATGESDCQAIAVDAAGVYWTRPSSNSVRARNAMSGAVSSLGTNESAPVSIAADQSGVYWMTKDGKLRRSSRNETPIKTVAQGFASSFSLTAHIHAIALTSKYVVWITSDGKVLRTAK